MSGSHQDANSIGENLRVGKRMITAILTAEQKKSVMATGEQLQCQTSQPTPEIDYTQDTPRTDLLPQTYSAQQWSGRRKTQTKL